MAKPTKVHCPHCGHKVEKHIDVYGFFYTVGHTKRHVPKQPHIPYQLRKIWDQALSQGDGDK